MKISIIIPVYNVEKYLDQCIQSIVNQTYKNIEIILIDDGSTDNSAQICDDYARKDDRIKVVHKTNSGLSGSRNLGLTLAQGEYIMFLDSDDWIDTNTCQLAIDKIRLHDADIVLWSYTREYDDRSINNYLFGTNEIIWDLKTIDLLYKRLIGPTDQELKNPQNVDSLVTAWGKLYKKDILKDIYFVDTSIIGTEDALFNIYVFNRIKKACYIPDCLSHYRKTSSSSLTHNYKGNLVYQWKKMYEMIFDFLQENKKTPVYFEALQNRISLGLIGLGLNLSEDSTMSIKEKNKELKKILGMQHYQDALKQLKMDYFFIHWKFFFYLLKKRKTIITLFLLNIMNILRRYK